MKLFFERLNSAKKKRIVYDDYWGLENNASRTQFWVENSEVFVLITLQSKRFFRRNTFSKTEGVLLGFFFGAPLERCNS